MTVVSPLVASAADADGVSRQLPNGQSRDDYYRPFPPNYFAPQAGHQRLEIGIVGAGIAGLTAAVALLQAGHDVEVFERSRFTQELGAAIHMCPNASRILSHYEFDFVAGGATLLEQGSLLNGKTLELLQKIKVPDCQQLYGAPWYLFHRVDLHEQLKRLATEPRANTAAVAEIRLSSEVKDVGLDGTISFADGRAVRKDLVVVSDGVRNKLASKLNPSYSVNMAAPTGIAVYRFLVPREKLLADPQVRGMFEGAKFAATVARAGNTRLVSYPCRQGTLQNCALFVSDPTQGHEEEAWNIPASFDEFMQSCEVLHPDLQAVCRKAENLKLFRLCMRDRPLKALTCGNVVLIGDAAHPMLPHQAQGGAQAVEDGAALGVLFSNFKNKEEIAHRLQLYQQLRSDRVSAIETLSSVGQDEIHKVLEKARPFISGPLPTTVDALNEFNFTANVMRDALELIS